MGFGAFACGGLQGFGGFDGWQTAGFDAKKKLLGWAMGFGAFDGWQAASFNAKKKLFWDGPWCLCLRGWGYQKGFGAFEMGFGAFACGVLEGFGGQDRADQSAKRVRQPVLC